MLECWKSGSEAALPGAKDVASLAHKKGKTIIAR